MLRFNASNAAICKIKPAICRISPGSRSSVPVVGRSRNGHNVPHAEVIQVCQLCFVSPGSRLMRRNITTRVSVTTIRKTLSRGFSKKLFALANANKPKQFASSIFVMAEPNPRSDERPVIALMSFRGPFSVACMPILTWARPRDLPQLPLRSMLIRLTSLCMASSFIGRRSGNWNFSDNSIM